MNRTLADLLAALHRAACLAAAFLGLCSCGSRSDEPVGLPTPPAAARQQEAVSPAGASEVIWEGRIGGLRIAWTAEDLRVVDARGQVYSRAAALREQFAREMAELGSDPAPAPGGAAELPQPAGAASRCEREVRLALMSVVGQLVCLGETTTTSCEREAHPAGETRWVGLDFARAQANARGELEPATASLSDYFPEGALFKALREDRILVEALASAGTPPDSLPDLLAALASAAPVVDEKRCFAFADDLLARFAFHHVEGSSVAVRLGLPGAGPCRERLTQIGILLPTPPALRGALGAAAAREAGFLQQDAASVHVDGRRETILRFRHPP